MEPTATDDATNAFRNRRAVAGTSGGESREDRAARVALGAREELDLHGRQHLHHPVADVVGDHGFNPVVEEESRDAGVMARRRTLIVQTAPGHLDQVPRRHHTVSDVGHR